MHFHEDEQPQKWRNGAPRAEYWNGYPPLDPAIARFEFPKSRLHNLRISANDFLHNSDAMKAGRRSILLCGACRPLCGQPADDRRMAVFGRSHGIIYCSLRLDDGAKRCLNLATTPSVAKRCVAPATKFGLGRMCRYAVRQASYRWRM